MSENVNRVSVYMQNIVSQVGASVECAKQSSRGRSASRKSPQLLMCPSHRYPVNRKLNFCQQRENDINTANAVETPHFLTSLLRTRPYSIQSRTLELIARGYDGRFQHSVGVSKFVFCVSWGKHEQVLAQDIKAAENRFNNPGDQWNCS
jgi:hypothetical protein